MLDATSKMLSNMIGKQVDVIVEKAVGMAVALLKSAVETTAAELRAASTVMVASAMQLIATTTSYRDILQNS